MKHVLASTAIALFLAAPLAAQEATQPPAETNTLPPASTEMPATPMDSTAPAFEREGYITVDHEAVTTEQIEGAMIFDENDEDVGSVEELVIGPDGKVEAAVADVGGFLGIGAHRISLAFDEMQFMETADESDFRIYIDATKDELAARPEYTES